MFSVDPQLWVRSEGLYVRYEDTIVVTEKGYENFTDFLPSELDALEKLTREKGIVQMYPGADRDAGAVSDQALSGRPYQELRGITRRSRRHGLTEFEWLTHQIPVSSVRLRVPRVSS